MHFYVAKAINRRKPPCSCSARCSVSRRAPELSTVLPSVVGFLVVPEGHRARATAKLLFFSAGFCECDSYSDCECECEYECECYRAGERVQDSDARCSALVDAAAVPATAAVLHSSVLCDLGPQLLLDDVVAVLSGSQTSILDSGQILPKQGKVRHRCSM